MRSLLPLLLLLLLSACAATPGGRAADRVTGRLLLAGTEQAIAGARIVLLPLQPHGSRSDESQLAGLGAVATTNREGGFALAELDGEGQRIPLLRGWTYEVRAEAGGFHSESATVEYGRGELSLILAIEPIDDDEMTGEVLLDTSSEAVDNPRGTLIREVLRRQGRLPLGER